MPTISEGARFAVIEGTAAQLSDWLTTLRADGWQIGGLAYVGGGVYAQSVYR